MSEVVLSALVGFSLQGKWRNDNAPPDSSHLIDFFGEKPDSNHSLGMCLDSIYNVMIIISIPLNSLSHILFII